MFNQHLTIMKKVFLLICLLTVNVLTCLAQDEEPFTIIGATLGDPFGIVGGKDGKIYQIIVKTGKSKKEVVDLTAKMLQSMGIVKAEEVKRDLDKVNDKMSEYSVPFYFPTGIGIHPAGSEPLLVYGTFRFEFYDGGVKLSIEDFDEQFFIVHKTNTDRFERTENMKVYDEYCAEAAKAAKATSGFGKLIAKIDKVQEITHISGTPRGFIEDAKKQFNTKMAEADAERLKILDDYRSRVVKQQDLFDKMIKAGEARWYTLDSYMAAAKASDTFNKYEKAATAFMNKYEKAREQNKLYALPAKRWHRDIRYIFDGMFLTLAEVLEGSIEGVAEDGVQTWEREGDLVVPTDPKQKAKYLKKKKSFTDYESYDN